MGSSPRVRGKPLRADRLREPRGLIPARAGKTGRRGYALRAYPAHPRACGENTECLDDLASDQGSSPRVRGKRRTVRPRRRLTRLIPARAGKTVPREGAAQGDGAHPRACGENRAETDACSSQPGSSPRVRGKLHPRAGHARRGGLIPARAGKTSSRQAPIRSAKGSSPRVRGKPRVRPRRQRPEGLIPARAGKTTPGGALSTPHGAHPRACGENGRPARCRCSARGSSPRVRGKLDDDPSLG